jgi:DNA-binding NarL/FixJ family response regulator
LSQATKDVSDMGKGRVLLADVNATILNHLRSLLFEEFEIAGAVNNGRDAIAETRRVDPDVLVIEIALPVFDGLQVASRLAAEDCRTRVMFLTTYQDRDFVDAAFVLGACGYVLDRLLRIYRRR